MSITNKRREALVDHLVKEMGVHHVREFSESLRILDICDLKDDNDLITVTENGMIDALIVLYRLGTLTKVIEIKGYIADQRK